MSTRKTRTVYYSDPYMPIFDNMKYLRELTKKDVNELAHALGLTKKEYLSLEDRDPDRILTTQIIVKLSDFYGINPDTLFDRRLKKLPFDSDIPQNWIGYIR